MADRLVGRPPATPRQSWPDRQSYWIIDKLPRKSTDIAKADLMAPRAFAGLGAAAGPVENWPHSGLRRLVEWVLNNHSRSPV
jgi:hypothetical protein